jgi:peptide/nickel transport system ATP-binding protein
MIAMALICHPNLLIADEPTTALDVTVQKTILELLRSLQQKYNIGIIFITHDLGVIAQIADDVAVMYKGKIVEQGPAEKVLHHPQHPYTQGLLACRPPLDSRPHRLPTVKEFLEGREVAQPEADGAMAFTQKTGEPLMSVRDLEVTYALEKNIFGKTTKELKAVDGFSFDIFEGETLGLVGESGCGKSTLGRTLLRLLDHSSGTITYRGHNLDKLSHSEQHELRRKVQIVFQDPYSSLNPRITIGEAILEPLRCHHLYSSSSERRERVMQLMKQVGLEPEWYNRYPHEFSGGQRQRVCIARALILEPELVVCDESVSALDVSVQAQVLNLLNELKETYGYTYLFITHDLSVVKFLSDRIMVMEKGRLVETAPSDELFAHPQHPYTQRLLSAIPRV